jgi:NADH-quinone oxidoreductase subunit L
VIRRLGPVKGRKVMGWLAVLPIFAAFGIGVYLTSLLAQTQERAYSFVASFDWIHVLAIRIPFELTVDTLSMTMVLVITGVGALIHLYATGYMAEEPDYARFFSYLNLFVACMLMLVLGGNLPLTFIGWEGVGLCSYLLIGFWFKDLANSKAANKAFIVNRIGDWGLTLGMFLLGVAMAVNYQSLTRQSDRFLSYDVILPNVQHLFTGPNAWMATVAAILLFVGACGKSAQFPLYLWLPDAMAGPTPVSALIHAATMVTAGVYLLNRVHILFLMSPFASGVVCVISIFTAAFAALVAFAQTDIKKVLAYSTVSQLGFMFLGCGAGAYWTGMFHVVTHAFFKALLFLGAGAVIHAMAHDQDMRHYGNLRKYIPITFWTMVVAWLAISGIPLLSGAYSKESIISAALGHRLAAFGSNPVSEICGYLSLLVAMLTAWYMTRLMFMTFYGKEQWRELTPEAHVDEHHDAQHSAHADHHGTAHHGDDIHGFFYTDAEMAARKAAEPHEHHHALTPDHQPKEVPPSMWITLVVLAILSAGAGFVLNQNGLFEHWLYPKGLEIKPLGEPAEIVPGTGLSLLVVSTIAAVLGILLGWMVTSRGGRYAKRIARLKDIAFNQFYYDKTMMDASVNGGREFGLAMWKGIDVAVIDGVVNGVAKLAGGFGALLRRGQSGYVRAYALLMLFGGVGILCWLGYALLQHGGVR